MELSDRDLEDIRALVENNPGASLSRLKIKSRHARERVRAGTKHLAEQGVLVEAAHANSPHYWVAEDAPEDPEAVLGWNPAEEDIDQRRATDD